MPDTNKDDDDDMLFLLVLIANHAVRNKNRNDKQSENSRKSRINGRTTKRSN